MHHWALFTVNMFTAPCLCWVLLFSFCRFLFTSCPSCLSTLVLDKTLQHQLTMGCSSSSEASTPSKGYPTQQPHPQQQHHMMQVISPCLHHSWHWQSFSVRFVILNALCIIHENTQTHTLHTQNTHTHMIDRLIAKFVFCFAAAAPAGITTASSSSAAAAAAAAATTSGISATYFNSLLHYLMLYIWHPDSLLQPPPQADGGNTSDAVHKNEWVN